MEEVLTGEGQLIVVGWLHCTSGGIWSVKLFNCALSFYSKVSALVVELKTTL